MKELHMTPPLGFPGILRSQRNFHKTPLPLEENFHKIGMVRNMIRQVQGPHKNQLLQNFYQNCHLKLHLIAGHWVVTYRFQRMVEKCPQFAQLLGQCMILLLPGFHPIFPWKSRQYPVTAHRRVTDMFLKWVQKFLLFLQFPHSQEQDHLLHMLVSVGLRSCLEPCLKLRDYCPPSLGSVGSVCPGVRPLTVCRSQSWIEIHWN